jgi:neutral ceramidase
MGVFMNNNFEISKKYAVLLKAGAGRADITPPVGTTLMGYAPRKSTNVLDNLTATALMMEYGNIRTVILSITTTIIDDYGTERIKNLVSSAFNIEPELVTVCSCQIHSGPATQTCYGWDYRNDEYCENILEPGIIKAVQDAKKNLTHVRIGIGTTYSQVGINRRQVMEDGSVRLGQNPWGAFDPTMTVIRFISDNDDPVANIVHYGAHPTSIGATGDITRDWPGIMIDKMEEVAGGITLFLNGAVGDVGPRLSNGRTTGDVNQMIEVGNRAAFDTITAFRSIKEFNELDLEIVKGEIILPYRPLPPLETAREKFKLAESRKHIPGLDMAEYMYWNFVIQEYEKGAPLTGKTRKQTITRIGSVVMIPFSGEPFAEIVLRMREYSHYQHTLCLSTTNGSDGYYATRDSLHRGGYEVLVAKAFSPYILSEDIDDVLIIENLRLIRKMGF